MVLVRICVPLLMRQCGPNISQHRLHGSLSNDKVHGETSKCETAILISCCCPQGSKFLPLLPLLLSSKARAIQTVLRGNSPCGPSGCSHSVLPCSKAMEKMTLHGLIQST